MSRKDKDIPAWQRSVFDTKPCVETKPISVSSIKQLEKEIENNKNQAKLFINSIVKKQVKEDVEEQTETISVNTEPIDEVQNEIVSVEEEVIIEPKPKTKIIIKKKVPMATV